MGGAQTPLEKSFVGDGGKVRNPGEKFIDRPATKENKKGHLMQREKKFGTGRGDRIRGGKEGGYKKDSGRGT